MKRVTRLVSILVASSLWPHSTARSFLDEQLAYPRVKNCVTIGCIPITDDGIKEVYWLAALSHQAGEKQIPIWIFPTRLPMTAIVRSHDAIAVTLNWSHSGEI